MHLKYTEQLFKFKSDYMTERKTFCWVFIMSDWFKPKSYNCIFNDSLIESTHKSHLLVNWTTLFALYVCFCMQLARSAQQKKSSFGIIYYSISFYSDCKLIKYNLFWRHTRESVNAQTALTSQQAVHSVLRQTLAIFLYFFHLML